MGISTTVLQLIAAGTADLDGLASASGEPKKAIVKAVQILKSLGYVDVCDELDAQMGTLARGWYALTAAGQAFAASGEEIKPGRTGLRPRKKTVGLRERAWWHLRAHRVTTLKELLATHASGSEKAAHINLYKYLAALEGAGVLARQSRRQPAQQGRGRVVWSLQQDLGPQAPVWRQRGGVVYDPNADIELPIQAGASHEPRE